MSFVKTSLIIKENRPDYKLSYIRHVCCGAQCTVWVSAILQVAGHKNKMSPVAMHTLKLIVVYYS
jgi:hypothetical protein